MTHIDLQQEFSSSQLTIQERPKEVLTQLGGNYQRFMSNLVQQATARRVPGVIVVNVGGLSESGKSTFISQASVDFAEHTQIQSYERQYDVQFRQLTIEQGDGMFLMQRNYETAYPDQLVPDRQVLLPEHYRESSASMSSAVSLAGTLLPGPLVIWVEGTMLPGILSKDRQIIGVDKALSTAANNVQKFDAFTVLMFASDEQRGREARYKDKFKNMEPSKIERALRRRGVIDDRSADELKNYFLFHTSNSSSRQRSVESMWQVIESLVKSGELTPSFDIASKEELVPDEKINFVRGEYGRLHLQRLYGEDRRDRGFLLFNKDLREITEVSKIHNYASEQRRVVHALADYGRETNLIVHRQLIEGLGIDLNNPIP